ncbi:MAG: hypothetical protein V1679_03130 [Candidatus Peregrinibacteria bacterium]
MTKTISVKQLRMNFPKIRMELKKGAKFTIIYRSLPIATLTPLIEESDKIEDKKYDLPKDMEDFVKNIDKYVFKGGKPFDAVKEIRKDRDESY